MGLLGPSWSWEEIQRKDSIMNDLKRENDRVLEKQRKENDRVIRELGKNNSSNTSSSESYYSLTPDEHYELNEYLQKERRAHYRRDDAIVASKKRYQSIRVLIKNEFFTEVFGLLFLLFLVLISRKILILFILFLVLTIGGLYSIIKDIMKYVLLIESSETKKLKNTDCYKKILEEMKKMDLEKIDKIEIDSICISVHSIDKTTTIYKYSSYNFPELPFEKQGHLLGSLIYDLGLSKDFDFSCEVNQKLTGTNTKLHNKLEKEKKQKEKQKEKERQEAINNGKSW